MVRIPILTVIFVAMLPLAPALAQSSDCDSYSVNAGLLNLRSGPSITGSIVDVLHRNQIVCIGEISDETGQPWGRVTGRAEPDGSGYEPVDGWSNMNYLAAAALPQAWATNDTAPTADVTADSTSAADTEEPGGDTPAPQIEAGTVAFSDIIDVGPYPVRGRSLEQLVNGIPLFPPIEGLPEARWKNQCATCHKWDRDRLCDQGKSYAADPASAFRIQHPYGSPFKKALGAWAAGGCP